MSTVILVVKFLGSIIPFIFRINKVQSRNRAFQVLDRHQTLLDHQYKKLAVRK